MSGHYNEEWTTYLSNLHKNIPDSLEKSVEVEDRGGFEGLKAAVQRNKIRELRGMANKPDNKYLKEIKKGVFVDVYDITEAYEVSHAIHHAIKKLLMAGQRGNKVYIEDLSEAIQAIEREIERQSE